MTYQPRVRCATCGRSWPAPGPDDLAHEDPSVLHAAETEHDDWRVE